MAVIPISYGLGCHLMRTTETYLCRISVTTLSQDQLSPILTRSSNGSLNFNNQVEAKTLAGYIWRLDPTMWALSRKLAEQLCYESRLNTKHSISLAFKRQGLCLMTLVIRTTSESSRLRSMVLEAANCGLHDNSLMDGVMDNHAFLKDNLHKLSMLMNRFFWQHINRDHYISFYVLHMHHIVARMQCSWSNGGNNSPHSSKDMSRTTMSSWWLMQMQTRNHGWMPLGSYSLSVEINNDLATCTSHSSSNSFHSCSPPLLIPITGVTRR